MDIETNFQGKTVLVTGSTQNLGHTIAQAFALSGARVLVHGPHANEADAVSLAMRESTGSKEIHSIAFDLSSQDAIDAGFNNLGRQGMMPDILVNNAAHLGMGNSAFLEQSPEFFRKVLEVNVFGVFRCSQLAAAVMKVRGAGAIINISSLASERSIWCRSAYNTSKAALDGMTRSMALELAEQGIRVNAIAPGYIWTPRWNDIPTETEDKRRNNLPGGEPTQQEEIARLVRFLASDAAPSMIGSRLVIDGGLNAQQTPRDFAM